MSREKNMTFHMYRQKLLIKSQGAAFWFPFVMMLAIVPLMALSIRIRSDIDPGSWLAQFELKSLTQIYLPFTTTWWFILSYQEDIEGQGRELLKMLRPGIQWAERAFYFALNLLLLIGCYALLHLILGHPWYEIIQTIMMAVFFIGLSQIIIKATQSLTITILALFLYTMVCVTARSTPVASFPIYYHAAPLEHVGDLRSFIIFMTTGLILIVISINIPVRTRS